MNENQNNNFKKLLNTLRQLSKQIESRGYEIQKTGLELTTKGKYLDKCVSYLSDELPKYEKIANDHPNIKLRIDSLQGWLEYSVTEAQNVITLISQENSYLELAAANLSTISSSGSSIFLSIDSGINQIHETNDKIDIYKDYLSCSSTYVTLHIFQTNAKS